MSGVRQKLEELKTNFVKHGQGHVFQFIDLCSESDLNRLYEDVSVNSNNNHQTLFI